MSKKVFEKGKIYSHEEYIELSIQEMRESKSEHQDKTDPIVGAILVDPEGRLVETAHRGEIRSGDHAEYTIFSKKLRAKDVTGYTLYTTLEPCVEREDPKMGCSFQREEKRDIPYRALLEVIMNAIVHRDYSLNPKIMIDVDEEKVVVSSPGIPLAPIEKFRTFSVASNSRNPKIAYILFEMGLVEERGFGMEELSKLENNGYPKPTFELDDNILKTTLYRGTGPIVEEKELKGLKELQEYKVLTSSKYVEITNVAERTARRHLNDLVKAGRARQSGDGPTTEYHFIE